MSAEAEPLDRIGDTLTRVEADENYRSELIWRLLRRCSPVVIGLRRAGFRGGWLDDVSGRIETSRHR